MTTREYLALYGRLLVSGLFALALLMVLATNTPQGCRVHVTVDGTEHDIVVKTGDRR